MPDQIFPPSYLLQTNFGLNLASLFSKEAVLEDTNQLSSNDKALIRLSAEGVLGDDPELLIKGNTEYSKSILSIVNKRFSDLERGKEQVSSIKDDYLEDPNSHIDNTGSPHSYNVDDDLLLMENGTFSGSQSKELQDTAISSILIEDNGGSLPSYPLPNRWLPANQRMKKKLVDTESTPEQLKKKEEFLRISEDGLVINAVSNNTFESVYNSTAAQIVFLLKGNNCIPSECGLFYFEVKIKTNIKSYNLSLGFAKSGHVYAKKTSPSEVNSKIAISDFPGRADMTFGFNGQSATVGYGNRNVKSYGYSFGYNDIIGCGIDFYNKQIFYTKNGEYLGPAFTKLANCQFLTPVIGFNSHNHNKETDNNMVHSLTNNVFQIRNSNNDRSFSSTNFQSFTESLDQYNNNYVLHEIITNFGLSKDGRQEGENFYFDINGYINKIKSEIYTKVYRSNLELCNNYESSVNLEKLVKQERMNKQFSIPSLLNDNAPEIDVALKDLDKQQLLSTGIDRQRLVLKDFECKSAINSLIKNYFDHLGYVDAKKSFLKELESEKPISGSEDVVMLEAAPEDDAEEVQSSRKRTMRELILGDDIDGALKFLQQYYNEFFNINESDYGSNYATDVANKKGGDKLAESLVFELQCIKLIKLIRKCIDDGVVSSNYEDEAICFTKYLMKQHKHSSAKVRVLNGLFQLLITENCGREERDGQDDEDVYEEEYISISDSPRAKTKSFDHLLRDKNFESLKLKITDRLNSFILKKSGKSAISDLEKVVNLTNFYLRKMNRENLADEVVFININNDVLN
ncbi:glucose-induced degradation complex subunit [Saccharomycopsis crataegensis]|uniref:Glucose-induced degradation complex subunit n=1 Tax=Saccharomycopsis crataegensis TaxID=43959 RepID=A0AAV5QN73_9ASCO|nr:glucose-induced degradation complex subunit [Saccharomycopsis crataegensis]